MPHLPSRHAAGRGVGGLDYGPARGLGPVSGDGVGAVLMWFP